MLNISTASLQYVPAQVSALKEGVPYNPTADTVYMAFTPGVSPTTPTSGFTFYLGSWDVAQGAYYALCLVGPGGTTQLASGIWTVWVKVTDNPEVPIVAAGQIQMV